MVVTITLGFSETPFAKKVTCEPERTFQKKRKSKPFAEKYAPAKVTEFTSCEFPAQIQPKLKGIRCVAYRGSVRIRLVSRGGHEYIIPHIARRLFDIMKPGQKLDGELYIHGKSQQQIQSLVKQGSEDIQFHVFDGKTLFQNPIYKVETFTVNSKSEINKYYKRFLKQGYEGAVIRSNGLAMKKKPIFDAEFEVVSSTCGKGKHLDCVIWVCKTSNGKLFKVVPACSLDERKEFYKNRIKYIGKFLTVKYQSLTDAGIPECPIGDLFRIKEDFNGK